jgi:methylase of polypeptide subunit release factors
MPESIESTSSALPRLQWKEQGKTLSAEWRAENGSAPPARVVIADDTLKANDAFHMASEGTAILWRGDFQNAKQLLQALQRRIDAKADKKSSGAQTMPDAFHRHRMAQAQRAKTLSMLLIPFDRNLLIPLGRAPDVADACRAAWNIANSAPVPQCVVSLRELLGIIGAYEWRRKGVPVTALDAKVHPHYGIFAPIRSEYVDLVNEAPLPPNIKLAFDIGTGTGVLSAVLAKRGVAHVIATDLDPRALACANENITRLKQSDCVSIESANLFPTSAERADLIVCNPPWLPGKPASSMERAIYDANSGMLRGFLSGLAAHLNAQGEGWLILSDLAEHLQLRSRETLLQWIQDAKLEVIERVDTTPTHARTRDTSDPLHAARAKEITSLWRLRAAESNGEKA